MSKDTSSLIEEIKRVQRSKRGGAFCDTGRALGSMNESDRQEWLEAFADYSIRGTAIAAVLKSRGYEVSAVSVQRHRRKECTCD